VNHTGSCHCGKVAFEVEGEIKGVMACNCSICHRKGAVMWFVPRDSLKVQAADADLGSYTFNKHVIKHRFCRNCGIHTFGEGVDPKGNRIAAINLRCVDGVDLKTVETGEFDGRSL
jgi:hypothetical protein